MSQAEWAEQIARKLLERPLPLRCAHSQGVAAKARTLALVLGDAFEIVEVAAWLHDVGYSPGLVATGFHPLDGARYLRDAEGADGIVCRLVAHHSNSLTEAEERGMRRELLREFALPPPELVDALTYCDMTTGPGGAPVGVHERLQEIKARYGTDHVVTRSIARSSPAIIQAVHHIQDRLKRPTLGDSLGIPAKSEV